MFRRVLALIQDDLLGLPGLLIDDHRRHEIRRHFFDISAGNRNQRIYLHILRSLDRQRRHDVIFKDEFVIGEKYERNRHQKRQFRGLDGLQK